MNSSTSIADLPLLQPAPRAALYLRVSTGRQAENDLSIPDQKRQAEAYCLAKGWRVSESFVEPGASATDDRRPEFQRLMEAAAAKPRRFDIVVVHSFSRFFRDHFELEFNVRRLAKSGIKLISITQELDDSPTSIMMRQIMALFDEYQSRENAKHTLRAMNENARQGFWNGSRPPFGYRTVEAERRGQKIKKRLDIDPIQAETVRLIFDLYLEGDGTSGALGLKAIVNRLNAQGYRTQAGSKFSCKFIHQILTRPAYTGTHYFNAVEAKTGRQKSSEDMVAITIPSIIPKDRFEDVQQRLKHNAPRKTAPRIVNGPCLLTGLAVCATCEGGMTLRTGKYGRYRYYTCATQARMGKTACEGRSIRMDLLDSLVMEHLAARLLTKERLGVILQALLAQYAANQNNGAARQEALHAAVREADQKVQRLYAAIENGIADISDPTLKERLDALKAQRDDAKRLYEMAEAPAMVVPTITDEMIERFAHDLRLKLLDGPIAMRKAYLQTIVDRIEVDDQEIRVFGRKDRLLNQLVSGRPKPSSKVLSFGRQWRPQGDSNPCYRRERAVSWASRRWGPRWGAGTMPRVKRQAGAASAMKKPADTLPCQNSARKYPARCKGAPPTRPNASARAPSFARNSSAFMRPPPSPSTITRMVLPSLPIRSLFTTRARGITKSGSSLPVPNGPMREIICASAASAPPNPNTPSSTSSALGGNRAALASRSFRNS